MTIERMAFIVTYKGKEVPKKLEQMDVNLAYVSKRMGYSIVYYDKHKGEKLLLKELKNIKGFIGVEASKFFNDEANIVKCQEKILDTEEKYDTINEDLK